MYYYLLMTVTIFFLVSLAAGGTTLQGGISQTDMTTSIDAGVQQQTQTIYGNTNQQQLNPHISVPTLTSQLAKFIAKNSHRKLQSNTSTELYCVGVQTYRNTGAVVKVDPNSHLYGIVQIGDVIDSMDGETVLAYTTSRHNYANADTPVKVHINYQDGRREFRLVQRVPVANVDSSGMLSPY